MYVFNGEYKNYLKIMTTFKINRKKFRNLKQFDGDDSYEKIKSKFNNLENTSHFLHLIIYSGFPFIFLYIYDIKSEFSKFKEESQKTNEELLITKNELSQYKVLSEKTSNELVKYKALSEQTSNELVKYKALSEQTSNELIKYKALSEQTSNELSTTKEELLKYKDISQKTNDELLKTKEIFY